MMESHRDDFETYRLIITRRTASEILLIPNGSEWSLPRVQIHPQQRAAEQLNAEAKRAWGVETYCLFVATPARRDTKGYAKCAVMESVQQNERARAGMCWMPVAVAENCGDAAEAETIRESLQELESYVKGGKIGPFARPSWLRELFSWAGEQVAPLGLRLTGAFQQLNASPSFSLIRLETDGPAVWFKAVGEPNVREFSITLRLAQLFPNYLPSILGVHREWNGWLATEIEGTSLAEIADGEVWQRVAQGLAELQISSVTQSAGLLDAKCKDLRIPALAERIDPFLARVSELMALQEKPTPAPLTDAELAILGEGLKDSCALLDSFGFPDTLGHIDFNPGNIFVGPRRCVFLDWAEGCVGNPLLTFEYLCRQMERGGISEPAGLERVTSAYFRPWTSFYSPEDLRRALAVVPLIAVFAYAVSTDSSKSPELKLNSRLAGYCRSLARRMYREAIEAGQRSEVCLE